MGLKELQRWNWKRAPLAMMFLTVATVFSAGCAATRKSTPPPSGAPVRLLTATKQQLVASYNEQANSIHSVNSTVSMKLIAGTAYSGVIQQYHEIKGFILAQKPASMRVIGQAPIVGTNIFDMVSNSQTFSMYIPSKSKFVEGPANLQRQSAKPIENLRPQHLTEAIFWNPIAQNAPILFEAGDEADARYYILTIAAGDERLTAGLKPLSTGDGQLSTSYNGGDNWQIAEKIWFDRTDLSVARLQVYDSSGSVQSDIRYAQWDAFGAVRFAREIEITRPEEDYQLRITIQKLTANETIPPERFELKQPPGTQLVRVVADTGEPKP
jgi:outer membrane lipoprotein-sorting protein